MAAHLQSPPRPHRAQGPTTRQPRPQPHGAVHLGDGCFTIDPDIGALHEINGHFQLGPPKTAESARTVTLPPFLIDMWAYALTLHDHPHLFVTTELDHPRRSNFSRRAMRPATDGNHERDDPPIRSHPVKPGLTFHGLRHSHNTWLIADGIPDVGRARRLGHKLPDKIQEIYAHVAPEIEAKILHVLQQRWTTALTNLGTLDIGANHHTSGHLLGLPAA